MPPEENKNNNNLNTFKVGIDPVFKGNNVSQGNTIDRTNPVGAYGVLNNQGYTPTNTPATSSPQNITERKVPNQKSIIRTYREDMESAIQDNHLSSINIAIAESKKTNSQTQVRQEENTTATSSNLKNNIIIMFSLILIIAGIVALFYFYFTNKQDSTPITQIREITSLITSENKEELNVDTIIKDKFINALSSKLNDTQTPINNLYNIYITTGSSTAKRLVDVSEFISLIKLKMPDGIKRSLSADFMVGMYSLDKNQPFIIFKTLSFENTYAGMLAWETNIKEDLQTIFRLSGYQSGGGILNELTPSDIKKFEDGVISNKDVRILRDDNKNIMLLYGIVDPQTIVITVSDSAFREIVSRLNKEKTLQR
jgi:hypothetical protein